MKHAGTPEPPDALRLAQTTPLLIVTGMTLDAERAARPLAYTVREHALAWLALEGEEDGAPEAPGATSDLDAIVCTDIWWMNNPELRACPTISIGGPEQNALTAYLADKIPSVFAMDGRVLVQMDLDGADLLAACWGIDEPTTAAAVDRFLEGYLDGFLESVCARLDALAR